MVVEHNGSARNSSFQPRRRGDNTHHDDDDGNDNYNTTTAAVVAATHRPHQSRQDYQRHLHELRPAASLVCSPRGTHAHAELPTNADSTKSAIFGKTLLKQHFPVVDLHTRQYLSLT